MEGVEGVEGGGDEISKERSEEDKEVRESFRLLGLVSGLRWSSRLVGVSGWVSGGRIVSIISSVGRVGDVVASV